MSAHVAVAGGTGLVGRLVVDALRERGHEVSVLARSTGVDLLAGQGLDLAGVDAVVDVTNVVTTRKARSVGFFQAVTSSLLEAEERAGVGHHVVLSIAGIDRVGFGYYAGKLRQEEQVLAGPTPATVLRTTQFHQFAAQLLDKGGPVAVVPKMTVQPVAALEVAAALAELAVGEPQGRVPELAGPQPEQLVDMARRLATTRGARRLVIGVRLPGAAGRAAATGGLLPVGDGPRGIETFQQWLESQLG